MPDRSKRQMLAAETRLFRTAFEGSFDPILVVDPRTVIHAANPSTLRLVGAASHDVLGHSILDFVHPDDHARTLEALAHALPAVTFELRVRQPSGWRTLEAAGRAAGEPSLIVINAHDVTEQRVLREELMRTRTLDAIGRVMARIARELDNVRANTMIRRMIAIAHHEPGPPSNIDLNAVISDLEPTLQRLAGPKVSVIVVPTSQAARILSQPSEIEQILIDLVSNARDAMPHGGPISIATWRTETAAGHEIVLSVADRGTGMDAATRERIFEPFFTTKGGEHRSGLGLATVHQLVRSRGGRVTVISEVRAGTTFELSFPAAK